VIKIENWQFGTYTPGTLQPLHHWWWLLVLWKIMPVIVSRIVSFLVAHISHCEWPWLSFFLQVITLKTDNSIHHRLNARSGWPNKTAKSGKDEFIVGVRGEHTYVSRARMEKLHSGHQRTSQLSWFYYWQVVDVALMRLQSTILLVYSRCSLNRNMKSV